ncbi:DNA-processing protein DprA [Actinopolymorpha pittospori]|uniref:DNA-processing protein DprA n=1 Tax=Actinopolymorpha pittospori TaxID=648752 RepID=UPI003B58A972
MTVATVLDSDDPAPLRDIHQVPPIMFRRGELVPNDRAVSVVGSRGASDRGLRVAAELALVSSGDA